MRIKKFKNFIKENISVTDTDSPALAASINSTNKLAEFIKQYNQKKGELQNLYLQEIDENQLINQLFDRKYISTKGSKKQINFINPLLGKLAQSLELKKRVKDLEKNKLEQEYKIKEIEKKLQNNPSQKDSISDEIKLNQQQLQKIVGDLQKIKSESDRLERLSQDEFEKMKKKLELDNKNIKMGREF